MKITTKKALPVIFITLLLVFVCSGYNLLSSQIPVRTINPVIETDGIYFRYSNPSAEHVYLKSSFDQWTYRYAFCKTLEGYWELRLPFNEPLYQLKKGDYEYKLVVDGIYTHDQRNPLKEKNAFGVPNSIMKIPYDLYNYTRSPIHIEDDVYRFYVISDDYDTVEVVGSFNNFVPEELTNDPMISSLFYKDFILPRGVYYYSYIRDGFWGIDSKNTSIVTDATGRELSKVEIPLD